MHQKGEIIITVSDPEVRKEYGGAKQYYLYNLKGQDNKGPIAIQRRYSDFDAIRGLLVKRWPGCYIPSLPSKVKLAHSDEEFLQIRSKYLQKFLYEVARKPFLWQSDEMQIFLRNDMMDFDKVIAPLWKVDAAELLYRYGLHFKDVPVEGAMQVRIQNFSEYLSTLFVKVQELRNRSQQINSAQSKYQKKYSKFLLNVLASYQQKFLQYYNRDNPSFQPIFSSPENCEKKTDLEQSLKQAPLRVLFQQLKRQKRQIFAMQEAIKEYDDYVRERAKIQGKIKEHETKIAQLKAGKKSFLSKIRSLSSDQEVKTHEKAIEKYQAQLQTYKDLCQVITRVLLVTEIESFKQERTTSYYRMVQQIAQEELKIIEKERDFWMAVCNNNNFNFDIEEQPEKPIKKEIAKITTEIKVEQNKKEKEMEKQVEQAKQQEQKVVSQKQEELSGNSKRQQGKASAQVIKVQPRQKQQVTQKTKSLPDSPEQQKQIDSPHLQQIIVPDDDFEEINSDKEEPIKNSNVQIDVNQSPIEQQSYQQPPPNSSNITHDKQSPSKNFSKQKEKSRGQPSNDLDDE